MVYNSSRLAMNNSVSFFLEYLRNPLRTGAIANSSPGLVKLIIESSTLQHGQHVLELGPGEGAFTHEIVKKIGHDGAYLGLELNADFIERLKGRFLDLNVVQADAAEFDFGAYTAQAGRIDVVISSLPWAGFAEAYQQRILKNILPALSPDVTFTTFAYCGIHFTTAGQRFRRLLQTVFARVISTRTVWLNLPPAFVYVATQVQTKD